MNLPISIRGARPAQPAESEPGPAFRQADRLQRSFRLRQVLPGVRHAFCRTRRRFLDCLSARARQGIEQPDKRTWTVSRDFPPLFPWSSPPGTSIPGPCWEASRKSWITCASCTRRPGRPHDPETGKELVRQTPDQIADALASLPEQTRLVLTAPAEALLAQDPAATLGDFQRQGFLRIYWNGEVRDIEELGVPDAPAPDAALVIDRINYPGGKLLLPAWRTPCKPHSASIRTK